MTLIEAMARAIYATFPNGGEVHVPSTAPWERYRKEFRADTWEEAPDRHEQCRAIALAALKVLTNHPPSRAVRDAAGHGLFQREDIGGDYDWNALSDKEKRPYIWKAEVALDEAFACAVDEAEAILEPDNLVQEAPK